MPLFFGGLKVHEKVIEKTSWDTKDDYIHKAKVTTVPKFGQIQNPKLGQNQDNSPKLL